VETRRKLAQDHAMDAIDTARVREAAPRDTTWLLEVDHHVDAAWVQRCIRSGEYLIAEAGDAPCGFMRFSWFWGTVPFMDLIWVAPAHRRAGAGTLLFQAWEKAMRGRGAEVLMTSSMSDELEPQEWHRRNGFVASGQLTFGQAQAMPEVFFVKNL
jgi:GNAT superfamily N-acetyltransferase